MSVQAEEPTSMVTAVSPMYPSMWTPTSSLTTSPFLNRSSTSSWRA